MSAPRKRRALSSATLSDLGENRLVAELTRHLALGADVRCGAGDDCAVIGHPRAARWQLLKADAVIEGVHFLPAEDPRRVGWKALCRAISDIAAMGGMPAHALITIAAPPATPAARLRGIYAGLRRAARSFDVSIVGGETARSPGAIFINVALTGWVERTRCVFRSGGLAGDALYVTGRLGGSLAGRHLDFTPRLAEARWLVEHAKIHAMMDLSDGLAADLPRLASASHCGYELFHDRLPLALGCTPDQALADGEDYELLFAVAARDAAKLESKWRKQFPKLAITRIGTLRSSQLSPRHHGLLAKPRISTLNSQLPRGFDHFPQR